MPTSRDTNTNIESTTKSDLHANIDSNTDSDSNTNCDTSTEIDGLIIDCDRCALQDTEACDDCVVSFVLGREPDDAIVIDAEEARAMRMLERAGLVPSLRFDHRAG
jgi:hypothetical protein